MPISVGQHHQPGQDRQLVVLDGSREQRVQQFCTSTAAERAQTEVVLAFDGVALPAPFSRDVIVHRTWHGADLLGHERHHSSGWVFAGPQRTAGVTQVTEHQRVTEPVMIAAAALGRGQILGRHGVVAHQFALLDRRIEQLRDLAFT